MRHFYLEMQQNAFGRSARTSWELTALPQILQLSYRGRREGGREKKEGGEMGRKDPLMSEVRLRPCQLMALTSLVTPTHVTITWLTHDPYGPC